MSKITMVELESQIAGLQSQLDFEKNRTDNVTRIIRDNVKTKYGSVKQKDSEGNVRYVSLEEACDEIKP